MSSLYKLSITGVRAFSPKDNEVIEFGAPLTLICGQNGCGKTTVIECLKYATTGDLPPNSKGGAFVNDPAIADRLMVNAEVKLGFISVDGKSMTATRNMQLTRKRTGRGKTGSTNTFKTLEGQLAVIAHGKKTSISTKNNELDTRVPQYLGASKAILDYVIFCHQEESLWPLSEASVLKKRFDEIFEALKFTKVLDNLKTIRKDMQTDIKLIEQSVQHFDVDKNRAKKIKERLRESEAQVEEYSGEIAELTAQIEKLEKQADDLFHSNQSFQETLSEYNRLSMVYETTDNMYKRLGDSIDRLSDSDEQLAHKLANFAQIHEENTEKFEHKEIELVDLDGVLNELIQKSNQLTRDEGRLFSKREEYKANLGKLKEVGQRMVEKSNIDISIGDEKLALHLDQLQNAYKQAAKDLEELVNQKAQTQRQLEDSIMSETHKQKAFIDEISGSKSKIKDLNAKIASLSENEHTMNTESSLLESLKEKVSEKKSKSTIKDLQEKIEKDTLQLHVLEAKLEDVMKKIGAANKQSDLLSKLNVLKELSELKEKALQKAIATHGDTFKKATNTDLDLESAEEVLRRSKDAQDEIYKNASMRVNEAKEALQQSKAFKETETRAIDEMNSSLSSHLSQILPVIDKSEIDSYETIVEELQDDYNAATHNLSTFEVTKSFKIKAIEVAKQNKCCTLCNRGFESDGLETFIKEVEISINAAAASQLKQDVEKTKEDLDAMNNIRYNVVGYHKIIESKGQAEERLKKIIEEIKELEDQLSKADNEFQATSARKDDIQHLMQHLSSMFRTRDEVSDLKRQIDRVQADLDYFGITGTSMADLQKLQQETNQEVKTLRNLIAENTEEKNIQQKALTRLEGEVKDKELLISNLKNSMNEVINSKQRVNELQGRVTELEEAKTSIDQVIQKTKEESQKKLEEIELKVADQRERELVKKSQMEQFKQELDEFRSVKKSIARYEQHDEPLVQQNAAESEQLQNTVAEKQEEKRVVEREMKELQKSLNDAARIERNIQENLEFRKAEQQLDELKQQISELDVANAEKEKENYQALSQNLRDQIADLNAQYSGKAGELKQIKTQVQQIKDELRTEFKDVDKMYHQEWIKLQTNLLVSNDLQTYSQALDNAIMKYHSTKMDEINTILRELWNQTYRGTDIDRIEIKCDVNNQARGRTYDYRVVMYKKSSELDMRGRCSAGQKVLTSILIRLALAECFGTNCGMIALDEPTTNLDTENAESLAMALNSIIEFRKDQKNFQLIVITHDEKFLSHIHGEQYVDNFYKILRNENQNSVIKSLPIHLMQGE